MAGGTAIHACPARNAVPTDGTIDGNMRFLEGLDKVEHVLINFVGDYGRDTMFLIFNNLMPRSWNVRLQSRTS